MSVIGNILKNTTIPYTVGGKDASPIPLNVKLSIDPDFKKTVLIATGILGLGIGLGIGIINAKKIKR
jgi:hypothetical protein